MKFLIVLVTLLVLTATFLAITVVGAAGVTYVDHDKVAAAISKGGSLEIGRAHV